MDPIIIGGIVGLIVLIVGVYFGYKHFNKSSSSTPTPTYGTTIASMANIPSASSTRCEPANGYSQTASFNEAVSKSCPDGFFGKVVGLCQADGTIATKENTCIQAWVAPVMGFSEVTTSDGSYGATASTTFGGNNAYNAFDENPGTFWQSDLRYGSPPSTTSAPQSTSTASPVAYGRYVGFVSTTVPGKGDVRGEWLELKMPVSVYPTRMVLEARADNAASMPSSFLLLGSTSGGGDDWKELLDVTNTSFTTTAPKNFTIPTPATPVRRLRLITRALANDAVKKPTSVSIARWDISGFRYPSANTVF